VAADPQLSSVSEDWYTHPEIIALVHELLGGIDLDPMSCEEANSVVQAKNYYTKDQNGLLFPWSGRVLLNPPWGGSAASSVKVQAVRKLLAAYSTGEVDSAVIVLNANAMTAAWFAPLLQFPVCIPSRRIPHYGPGGAGGNPNSGTVVVYVGPDIPRMVSVFSRLGTVMVACAAGREQ
jgi:hypothetical protein